MILYVRLEGWRNTYTNHFSSVECMQELLPEDKRFMRALCECLPHWYKDDKTDITYDPDYEHNKNIKSVVRESEDGKFFVDVLGFKLNRAQCQLTPEVKVPGQPYVPAQNCVNKLEPEYQDISYLLDVEEVPVDTIE